MKQFKKAGFITAGHLGDATMILPFAMRLKGLKSSQFDHDVSPYFYHGENLRNCNVGLHRSEVALKFINQFLKAYEDRPLFYYSHSARLSHHEWGATRPFDDSLSQFVNNFYTRNESKDAILVLLADHGHRYGRDGLGRNPVVRVEERSPIFSIMFPEWFKRSFPQLVEQVRLNSNVTISPYDIHATLQHLISLNSKENSVENRELTSRSKGLGQSIFQPMPGDRTCKAANIPPHFCTCSKWIDIEVNCLTVKLILRVIDYVNSRLKKANSFCGQLVLVSIEKVQKLAVDSAIFSVATDRHGRQREKHGFSSDHLGGHLRTQFTLKSVLVSTESYRTRENMQYEMTASLDQMDNFFDGISRLDMYGTDAKCVEDKFPHLREYCVC